MTLTNSLNGFDGAQELLIKLVEQSPEEWETRKRVVQVLYDAGNYRDASKLVWNAPEIPPVAEEMVFTARIVAKGQPERAVRLLSTVVERNFGCPSENLIMAKLLMKHGLTLQALRFYGAATAGDVSLIDENFELAMVKTDCNDEVWKEVAKAHDFPWEGPRDMKISDIMTDEGKGEVSAAEILLDSVTQRVPLKAATAQASPQNATQRFVEQAIVEQPIVADQAGVSEVRGASNSSATMLSPAAEALVQQMRANGNPPERGEAGQEDQSQQNGGSFSSLVNFFKNKEIEHETKPAGNLPPAPNPMGAEPSAVADRGPVPSSSLIQNFIPTPSGALQTMVPEHAQELQSVDDVPRLTPIVMDEPAAAQEAPPALNQPPVQQHPDAQASPFSSEQISHQPDANFAPPAFDITAQAPSPFSQNATPEAPAASFPAAQAPAEDDLSDIVASALADREAEQPVVKSGGFFKKCKGFFGKSKKVQQDENPETPAEVEPGPVHYEVPMGDTSQNVFQAQSSEAPQSPPPLAEQAPSPALPEPVQATFQPEPSPPIAQQAPQPMSLIAPESVATPAMNQPIVTPPQEAAQIVQPEPSPQPRAEVPTSAPVPRQPEATGHAPPRELDGRTQLVALAPRDGNAFFEQLLRKYNALPEGQMSQAASISRDMANVDYMQLIQQACAKDLNAFSKLLGLHRVMSDARCYDWVNDMDLLRKGYGDAVLATVVSKYSVEECREILSAVYQQAPAAPEQAAAS